MSTSNNPYKYSSSALGCNHKLILEVEKTNKIIPKPKFKKNDKVVVNPCGTISGWTHVDTNLNHIGTATVVSREFWQPTIIDIETPGCPMEGYWEYKLEWKEKINRPLYGIPEKFLFLSSSKESKAVRKLQRLVKAENEIYNESIIVHNAKNRVIVFLRKINGSC